MPCGNLLDIHRMARERHKPDAIVAKLRQMEVLVS
jgi:hypothetical protein